MVCRVGAELPLRQTLYFLRCVRYRINGRKTSSFGLQIRTKVFISRIFGEYHGTPCWAVPFMKSVLFPLGEPNRHLDWRLCESLNPTKSARRYVAVFP